MSAQTVVTIREAVASKLAESGPQVNQTVIDLLAGKEIERRTTAILSGLSEKDRIEKDIRKIKPDNVAFNEKGEQVRAEYTKAKYEELKKANEKLDKVTKATEAALNGDYTKLFDYLEKNSGKAPAAEAAE
jgi:hypothetical protein